MKKDLRSPAVLLILFVLCTLCPAQQSQSQSTKPNTPRKQATPAPAEKPAETTPKPETATEQKPAIHEAGGEKDKEERYDMAEVPPVVTHHQITVEGKPLKYTATAGRLPIKRGDGKIEAEMFYVAYTLDGEDAAKRPLTFAFNVPDRAAGAHDRRRRLRLHPSTATRSSSPGVLPAFPADRPRPSPNTGCA